MQGIFLDIETTGLDPVRHVAIDVALKVVSLNTGAVQGEFQSVIWQTPETWERCDPASLSINGYTYEKVSQGKNRQQAAQEIIDLFTNVGVLRGKTVFICQNPAFDRAFFGQLIPVYTQEKLNWPYHWLDLASMYWTVFNKQLQERGETLPETLNLSKNTISQHYHIPTEKYPHLAMNGVDHLIACYRAVMGARWD